MRLIRKDHLTHLTCPQLLIAVNRLQLPTIASPTRQLTSAYVHASQVTGLCYRPSLFSVQAPQGLGGMLRACSTLDGFYATGVPGCQPFTVPCPDNPFRHSLLPQR